MQIRFAAKMDQKSRSCYKTFFVAAKDILTGPLLQMVWGL